MGKVRAQGQEQGAMPSTFSYALASFPPFTITYATRSPAVGQRHRRIRKVIESREGTDSGRGAGVTLLHPLCEFHVRLLRLVVLFLYGSQDKQIIIIKRDIGSQHLSGDALCDHQHGEVHLVLQQVRDDRLGSVDRSLCLLTPRTRIRDMKGSETLSSEERERERTSMSRSIRILWRAVLIMLRTRGQLSRRTV